HWLALAPLPADLGRQVDDRPQHLQRDLSFQFAEVAGGQLLQVFAEVDDAEAVDRLGAVRLGGDAVIQQYDVSAGLETLVGHGFQQRQGDPVFDRLGVRLEVQQRNVVVGLDLLGQGRVLDGDEDAAVRQGGVDGVQVQRR